MRAQSAVATAPLVTLDDPAGRMARLFDAHHERLYRLARRLAESREDAWDLVQDTFLRAARDPGKIPAGPRPEEAWLVRVLINIRRDQWRKAEVRRRSAPLVGTDPATTPAHQESGLVAHTIVWRALDRLPPRRRAVIVLHDLEGASLPAIASLLGISVITVRWHLSRGRHELARVLRPRNGESR
jgi:RNA polymerase sigma-70 factor (ECF subfamily)